ncbi:hypothetical protein D1BOALGB6SA_9701 [Olavius sp. associated proteobacterium Delta 1]|nr:hypothetical protein D1BOALGB6SA_9701 [Olavius sp. associated proteobacterium Delta 1]
MASVRDIFYFLSLARFVRARRGFFCWPVFLRGKKTGQFATFGGVSYQLRPGDRMVRIMNN